MTPDPQPDFRPVPGIPEEIAPGLRRIVAPNPSPMTFRGTNTWIVGTTDLAVIDPGPDDPAHLDAVMQACGPGQRIAHVLVTHAHLDHSPLARTLADRTGAPVRAFGPADHGRSATMARLAEAGVLAGGEGLDTAFSPDVLMADGDSVSGEGWHLQAIHLPGHMAHHLGFAWNDTLFCGDLVMGWATSLISPPDGDLGAFMGSIDRLATGRWRRFHPGHGASVEAPHARLDELRRHRETRHEAIRKALSQRPDDAGGLARRIYTDIPAALLPAATRNVLAHLIALWEAGEARTEGPIGPESRFSLGPDPG